MPRTGWTAASRPRGPRYPVDAAAASWPGLLVGYDTDPDQLSARPDGVSQLWWRADAPVTTDWTVFTHLLGPARADRSILWAGQDARPGQGEQAMPTWAAGDLVLDEYRWQLRRMRRRAGIRSRSACMTRPREAGAG